MPARPRRSASRPRSPARPAPAAARDPAPSRKSVRCAAATASCARRRVSSRSSAPARTARAAAEWVIDNPCGSCAGSGRVMRERTLSVNIPPGVEDGTRIRLAGEGEAGVRGGPTGRPPHLPVDRRPSLLQRDGADLHCHVPISMVTAAMGGELEVPTIDGGKTRVKVTEGTQSGRRFRLQGKGMPVLRARQIGDMTCRSRSRPRSSSPSGSASCWPNSTACPRRKRSPNPRASSSRSRNSSTD